MSTAPDDLQSLRPKWCSHQVVTFEGQHDTHIDTGEDYSTRTLASIFTMEPDRAAKGASPAFIPSTYHDFDARNHARQRELGRYVALCADIDSGDHQIAKIESLVRGFVRDAAWLIYSSAHARPGDMRWRIILPLTDALAFDDWHDAQHALFTFLEKSGVDVDHALDRAGQPVYLPNVPEFHAKSGDRLRGDDQKPLYYTRASSGCTAPGLDVTTGPIGAGISDIRRKWFDDERERERIRKEAEERRARMPRTEGAPVMEEFNRGTSIATLFELYGYEQSPRNPDDWRSPKQTSDSYATRIMGDAWVSLSASDVGARLGANFKGGCFGDAYDLFVHYEHGGDHKAAFRALYSERRTASMASGAPTPPPVDQEDPGWTEPPEQIAAEDDDAELVIEPELTEPQDSAFHPVRFDPACLQTIPPRRWLVGERLQRGKVTGGIAPGGVGKSAFSLTTAIATVTGDSRLTGEVIHETGGALLIYNEEDEDEVHRRIAAICAFWDIDPASLANLHLMCSVSGEVKLVTLDRNGSALVMPEVGLVVEYCRLHGIVYVVCDPFITFHTMPENDNTNVDIAARQFSRIANEANVAIDLIHHISKGGDSESHAGDISRARGGGSIGAAIRNSYTLAAMSKETAEGYALGEEYVRFVRLDDGKRNYSLRGGEPDWLYLESVELPNGDSVGVIRPFDFEEIKRAEREGREMRMNMQREEMVAGIAALMAVPEVPLKQLAGMLADQHGKSANWGRTAIQSVIPPLPGRVEMHDCSLSIERRGTSLTAPLFVIKDAKTKDR